jgi:hypothetical protein
MSSRVDMEFAALTPKLTPGVVSESIAVLAARLMFLGVVVS